MSAAAEPLSGATPLKELFVEAGASIEDITGMAEHSAEVQQGFAFIASAPTTQQLQAHIQQACERGARVLLLDQDATLADESIDALTIRVKQIAQRKGAIAAEYYADPTARMTCLGVTGTNGKTSTAFYVADLLEKLGQRCGYCGTLGVGRLDQLAYDEQAMTTPNAVALQRIMAHFLSQDIRWCALEVSSHALDQKRTDGMRLRAGIFTNLSRDHLDYHQTMQAYGAAKARLFTEFDLDLAVINTADAFGCDLAEQVRGQANTRVVTYGDGADWSWQRMPESRVRWLTPEGSFACRVNLLADYQLANLTAAMAALAGCGFAIQDIMTVIPDLSPVPGRLELVSGQSDQPSVVVDFAHTPDALTKVLQSVASTCSGSLTCVVGCGGDRDRGKRSLMAAAALSACHQVWLTSDNPRSENPQAIIADMLAGVAESDQSRCHVESDRTAAIHAAIRLSLADDVVVIAGKGDERYQEIDGVKHPFDDREVARSALQAHGENV